MIILLFMFFNITNNNTKNEDQYIFKNHIIGQLFSRFSEVDISQKIFLIFSLGFYLFNIYQINHYIIIYFLMYLIIQLS